MFVRVVRFTDVSPEVMSRMSNRIKDEGGPPEGVKATAITALFDEEQRTAVVLQHFASAADMNEAAKFFSAMDPSETPGTRASVDTCEVALEINA